MLHAVAAGGQLNIIKFLSKEYVCRLDQSSVNHSLFAAARNGHLWVVLLLSTHEGKLPRPGQSHVNLALLNAIHDKHTETIICLLTLPKVAVSPDQNGVNEALYKTEIMSFLLNPPEVAVPPRDQVGRQ